MSTEAEQWRRSIEARVAKMEDDLAELTTASAVAHTQRKNVEKRLSSIEDSLKWLVRIVLGAIILAVIGYALQGGFAV